MAAEAPRQDVAQKLSQWLSVADAITLHAAHQRLQPVALAKPPGARAGHLRALEDEFQRVHMALVKAIAASGAAQPARNSRDRSLLPQTEAVEDDAGFAPHLQRYMDQQRQIAQRVDTLRGHVRQAVSLASPQLAQLASMDAVLEQMFGGREQKSMGTVPVMLERRFEQLRAAHKLEQAAALQPDDPARWRQPGGWQHRFGQDLEAALLAELDVRLQPVRGMMEALSNESEK